ncbi:glycosyltransferase [Embleya sp. NPDC020886]|uniref:glycosyltransferase n=1 Tax=Embleya sp. NPDC020886 TaxID=3363980 RepID=UPI0037A86100
MACILIVADSSGSAKGGVPAFNQRFAVAAARNHETYLLIPAQDNTQEPQAVAKDHPGVRVAVIPNPHTRKQMETGEELLPLLLNEFVVATDPDMVGSVPTLCADAQGNIVSGYLPKGRSLAQGPQVVIGHSRFSGLAPGSIVKGPRTTYEEAHVEPHAWYPDAKYAHLVHMEVERLGLVKEEPAGKRWLKILFETIALMDADTVACVGGCSFEWVWGFREAGRRSLPGRGIRARLHELVPGARLSPKPEPLPPSQTLRLLLVGRAGDKTKDAEGAVQMVRKMAPAQPLVPQMPYPARLTVLGMPVEAVDTWQVCVNVLTDLPENTPADNRMASIEPFGPPSRVVEEIDKADMVLSCSFSEAFSLVCLEGLQRGKPVVTSYNNGFARFLLDADRVPPGVGEPFVVRDQDVTGADRIALWATRLRDAREDLADLDAKVDTLRDILGRYTWEHCVDALVEAAEHADYDSKQIADGKIMPVLEVASTDVAPSEVDEWAAWWSL